MSFLPLFIGIITQWTMMTVLWTTDPVYQMLPSTVYGYLCPYSKIVESIYVICGQHTSRKVFKFECFLNQAEPEIAFVREVSMHVCVSQ